MKKTLTNRFVIILNVINLILSIILMLFVCKLNILPAKYILILIFVLIAYFSVIFALSLLKKKVFKIISIILTIILLIMTITVIKYSNITVRFLNKYFSNLESNYENKYLVISKEEVNNLDDLSDEKIGYYSTMPEYNKALDSLNISSENIEYDDINVMISALKNNEISAFIMEGTLYSYIMGSESNKDLLDFKILYEYIIRIKENIALDSDEDDIFNIYVGGLDFTENNTDFNMLITVNRKKHIILLTSIPRDYYVEIYDKGGKDILGYAGVWGINTSVKTVENIFDIPIDYYVRIHTNNLVDLVDTLGGVEFCSDFSFYTTHATIMGSYDDYNGKKLWVESGCHEYSGIEILTIARERLAYNDGDRQRQKNCQDIIINIFKKIVSGDTLSNYEKVLNSLGNSYTTNISKNVVTSMLRDTIDNPSVWQFIKQSVDGYSSTGRVHFSNYYDSVMEPNVGTIEKAKEQIKDVMNS